jgi:hypothetical protein
LIVGAFYVIRSPIFKIYNRLHSLFFKGQKICGFDAWKEVKLDKELSNEAVDPKIQYLIGYSWPTYPGHWYKGLQLKRYECKKPCNGETPCIR